MVVDDGAHVRADAIDLAVNEALEIRGPPSRIDGHVVEVVLHDVGHRHQLGRQGARHEVAVGRLVVNHNGIAGVRGALATGPQ